MSREFLFQTIADTLAQEFSGSLAQGIPRTMKSVDQLCTRFRASDRTVRKALRCLADRGILNLHQGWRALLALSAPVPIPSLETQLLDRICDGISAGDYRPGMSLPKLAAYGADLRVSRHLVRKVYRSLEQSGRVIRRGSSYVVAPIGQMTVSRTRAESAPAILVCQQKGGAWTGLRQMPLAGEFCRAFAREALNQGVHLEGLMPQTTQSVGLHSANGGTAVGERIRSLEGRYLG